MKYPHVAVDGLWKITTKTATCVGEGTPPGCGPTREPPEGGHPARDPPEGGFLARDPRGRELHRMSHQGEGFGVRTLNLTRVAQSL